MGVKRQCRDAAVGTDRGSGRIDELHMSHMYAVEVADRYGAERRHER